jgi:hypothetical protein
MTNFVRPIQQASWRTRRQRVGTILLVILSVVMVAALYLDVASRTTLVGREIQTLEYETSLVKAENANLKTELAELLSYHEVQARSEALGFRRATGADIVYLSVPGYRGQEPVNLVIAADGADQAQILSEAYTQSLFEWVGVQLRGGQQ